MSREKKLIFSIVLIVLNAAGAVGALLNSMDLKELSLVRLWAGVFLLCLFSAAFWSTKNKKRLTLQVLVFFGAYAFLLWLSRDRLVNNLGWGMQEVVAGLNERYNMNLVWESIAETGALEMVNQFTRSVLVILTPYILFLGWGVVRSKVIPILLADAVWFVAACGVDRFPDYIWLVLCVLGIASVVIRRAYRDDERAGIRAVLGSAAVLGGLMVAVYRFALPVFDEKYENLQTVRVDFSRKMNEEWIPEIENFFTAKGTEIGIWSGFGSRIEAEVETDVTGNLTGNEGGIRSDKDVYRVTFEERPGTAVYLRGFVGGEYTGDEWKAYSDSDIRRFYDGRDMELSGDGRQLMNMTYNVLPSQRTGHVWVEELAGAGSYCLYPYGSLLPADSVVHWDGTVERSGSRYDFSYREPGAYDFSRGMTDVAGKQYLRYVYDVFCRYPKDRLPQLTALLSRPGFRSDNVYNSLEDVLVFLRSNATYNLNVNKTPKDKDFVEYFLFERKEGYCAHFASAAVLMLRYLGVPARYATGYSASADAFSQNKDGTWSAVLTGSQAHAWAEVYLDGLGWMPVEMTPGAAPFSGDNTEEQLTLTGVLMGELDSSALNPPNEESEEPGESQDEAGSESPTDVEVEQPEDGQGSSEPGAETAESQMNDGGGAGTGGIGGEGIGGANGNEESEQDGFGKGASGVKTENGEGTNPLSGALRAAFVKIRSLLWGILTGCAVVAGVYMIFLLTGYFVRRSRSRRWQRADNREKVFLLYRNLRKLLKISGHPQALDATEREAEVFLNLLEKCSFGRDNPGEEELKAAVDFRDRLAAREYRGLAFYRKPLYRLWSDK